MGKQKKKYHSKELGKFFIILAVLFSYTAFAIARFGIGQGVPVAALTWSFFVFCTPVADAGFLVGLPLRIFAGIRMLRSQIGVWVVAFLMNVVALLLQPAIYEKTALLELFQKIITTPWPLWLIIIISAIGTLVSILFDDEAIDLANAKNKRKQLQQQRTNVYVNIAIFSLAIVFYILVLKTTHTEINAFSL